MKKLIITLLLLAIGYNLHIQYENWQQYQNIKELAEINRLEVIRCSIDNMEYCD